MLGCGQKSINDGANDFADANKWLALAKASQQPEKSLYLVKAGAILAQKGQYLKAQETFSFVTPDALSFDAKEDYFLYYGLALQNLGQTSAALGFFRRIKSPESHGIDWQITYRTVLSEAYLSDGNYYEAAKIRIELEDLLMDETAIKANHAFIWQALGEISLEFLKVYQTNYSSPIVNGWLELAYLSRSKVDQPEQLLNALSSWRNRYPTHPASLNLPEELQAVANAKIYRPKQIALLLPLSGKLAAGGRMIRDGIFAAHYNSDQASSTLIKVYDTANALSPLAPYEQAIKDGADFIIGPLTKESLEEIVGQEEHSTPQLSLNQTDMPIPSTSEIYQFGLPIEDEAKQIAQRAIAEQRTKAIVLAPNSEQGQRTIESFRKIFEELEGQIAEVQWYNTPEDIKQSVQQVLNIDLSEKRAARLQQVLGEPLEYVQRRRQDTDMVFLAASPDEARRIKPFLNYYFAQDLPVYSISKINSGQQDPSLNKDLNGIIFTDAPLLISNERQYANLRKQLIQIIPNIESPLGRLFALGYDAYSLIPNLNVMKAFNQYSASGLTGELSVDATGRVQRKLSLAKFSKGKANEIPPETTEE